MEERWVRQNEFMNWWKHCPLAARIYYNLRRQGLTVRSSIDCCIAQAALDNQFLLIHNDQDFEAISQVRSLQQLRFQP